jgi:hypothetical protein
MSHLLPGHTYQIQIWAPYWNGLFVTRFDNIAPSASWTYPYSHAGTSPVIDANESPSLNTGTTTNLAQYVLGTFIADGDGTENIYYYGGDTPFNSGGLIGAMQIREVPEPTTVALLALGGLALVVRIRIRQRKVIAK